MIREIRQRASKARGAVRVGIGDDCALIRPAHGEELAITTDFSLENVHFRRDWHPPESVGHRCLARGLSDLAAMGARPIASLLSLALPAELTTAQDGQRSWFERFLDGFLALAAAHNVPLIGGDTAEAPRPPSGTPGGLALADVVLLGSVKRGRARLRSGAWPGDFIYVTGALGGAAAELLALERNPASFQGLTRSAAGHPHLYPQPRVDPGRKLLSIATAAIDLSDGLSTDLRHICEESELSAEIFDLPLHPLAQQADAAGDTTTAPHLSSDFAPDFPPRLALNLALNGGEDYELLFTASPATNVPAKLAGVSVHRIGEMKAGQPGQPLIQMRLGGKLVPIEPRGWEHFWTP